MKRAWVWGGILVVIVAAIVVATCETPPERKSSPPTAAASAPPSPSSPPPSSATKPTPKAKLAKGTRRDRKARDELRRKIYEAFANAKPASDMPEAKPGPRSQPTPRAPPPAVIPKEKKGKLDKDYIQDRIREDFIPLAKECYEAALERDPELAGKLVFEFVIVGDEDLGGIVESAKALDTSTLEEEELDYCLEQSLLSLSFEPPEAGGSVTVTYPFVFNQAPDEGAN